LKYWDSIYLWDNSAAAYVDLEFAAADEPGTPLPLFGQPTDKIYVGLDRTFNGIYCELGVIGSGLGTFTYEYWDGSIWRNIPLKRTYAFNETGVGEFPIPINWTTRTLTGVENSNTNIASEDVAYYWLRIYQTATPTAVPTLERSFPFPSYGYVTPTEIADFLQLRQDFSATTSPSKANVETIMRRIEGRIEGYSLHSWKPKYRHEELYEFNRWGFVLKRYPVIRLFEVAIHNGSDYEVMTEGRSQDYFIDNDRGIVPLTRLMQMPYAYSRMKSWGFGEFKRAIRTNYIWGRDIDFDDRSEMVKDIVIKMVSADIISNYDYTTMVPQGTDRFSLEQKVSYWRESAEERLEELRAIRAFVP
jgi:hypothetical protein|tara:strand:+ start:1083 stop:2162 length:1080 start_codon:yes stop_codon:yes gene_type:complete